MKKDRKQNTEYNRPVVMHDSTITISDPCLVARLRKKFDSEDALLASFEAFLDRAVRRGE